MTSDFSSILDSFWKNSKTDFNSAVTDNAAFLLFGLFVCDLFRFLKGILVFVSCSVRLLATLIKMSHIMHLLVSCYIYILLNIYYYEAKLVQSEAQSVR